MSNESVRTLNSVGEITERRLNEVGIRTVGDILEYSGPAPTNVNNFTALKSQARTRMEAEAEKQRLMKCDLASMMAVCRLNDDEVSAPISIPATNTHASAAPGRKLVNKALQSTPRKESSLDDARPQVISSHTWKGLTVHNIDVFEEGEGAHRSRIHRVTCGNIIVGEGRVMILLHFHNKSPKKKGGVAAMDPIAISAAHQSWLNSDIVSDDSDDEHAVPILLPPQNKLPPLAITMEGKDQYDSLTPGHRKSVDFVLRQTNIYFHALPNAAIPNIEDDENIGTTYEAVGYDNYHP